MKEYNIQYGKEITQALSIGIDKNIIRFKDRNNSIYSELILPESAKTIKKTSGRNFPWKIFSNCKRNFCRLE